ncbi:MAG: Release factor glutamine methyltransferase [Verrucomicrobia subdivision 3 bacterium]|nr:Release factor glutamine methyltransferase [Limisphaerales bacterium]MCS1417314.1 Release factor glutamine methyltransferase [Limisphaerales bacterium]
MKTVSVFLATAEQALLDAGVPMARVDVEWLIEHVTGIRRLEIPLYLNDLLSESEERRLDGLVTRRCRREPLQYLIGTVPFLGVEIEVGKAALIPRPETELLAEKAIEHIRRRTQGGVSKVKVLDLGTGTGCLPIAISRSVGEAICWAVDVSPAALELAKRNVGRYDLADRIHLIESDLFQELRAGQKFDLIVSNPPYIPHADMAQLQPEVRDYDPHVALDGGPDGLNFYRSLALQGGDYLKGGCGALVEFGDGEGARIEAIFETAGWKTVNRFQDYGGDERVLEFELDEGIVDSAFL